LLAHKGELNRNFQFLKFDLFDRSIALFNDHGTIRASDNICPHRGTEFFQEAFGAKPMVCPYHSWSFLRGKLNIPNVEEYGPDFQVPKLNSYQVEFCGDFIFVAIHPENSLKDYLGSFFDDLERLSTRLGSCTDRNDFTFESSWRIAIENALEPLHVNQIHPQSLNKLKLEKGKNTFIGPHSLWETSVGDELIKKNLDRFKNLFEKGYERDGYFSYFIFPATMISSTYSFSFSIQTFLPQDQKKTSFLSRFYEGKIRTGLPSSALELFFRSATELNRQVFAEDHAICRHVRRDFGFGDRSILSNAEEKVGAFQAAWQSHMEL
jgi:phenylpropionate dioxygenase-like ring-hydroxylating dioxygenase large terminal subunit